MSPSSPANARALLRRLHYDLTGLPPNFDQVSEFVQSTSHNAEFEPYVDQLLSSAEYGQHFARLWLDVVRYADTDSFYRPDTKTPHYFPFAFTYRDYVIEAFASDKPYDQFIKEQLAADLMGFSPGSPEIAALGFLAVGPHANRATTEALDDWIDLTTRGLMGITVACARCHDHKYEPVPTTDYYALRGVFAALTRLDPLDDSKLPSISGYVPAPSDVEDFERQRAAIEAEIAAAAGRTNKGNNLPIPTKIRETKLAELLAFHPGGPAHAMIVTEKKNPPAAFVFLRGDAAARGERVERRFLQILAPEMQPYPEDASGRLQLAEQIVSAENPLTARVLVNRIWQSLIGSALVETDSDFGLQGAAPTHPELLDWLAADFVDNGWSIKHLVRTIVTSRTYQQSSAHRPQMAARDPQNAMLWRANRKHLSIESLRDSLLEVTGQLDHRCLGRPEPLWGEEATRRRATYGFINRFNLDPTLRAFDFPTPMQTQPARGESIVAPQALFLMNSPIVIEQAATATRLPRFGECDSDALRVDALFQIILQRTATKHEVMRAMKFLDVQRSMERRVKPAKRSLGNAWELVAHSLLMSNEFQYVD